jgi:hypothetical protein
MSNYLDIGSLLLFIGSLITLYVNRRTLSANAKATEADTDGKYQDQIDKLVRRNGELFEKMEAMRESYDQKLEALEKTLELERIASEETVRRMSRDIMNLQNDLRIERERNLSLMKQLDRQNDDQRIVKEDVKRITGKLPLPTQARPE